MRSQNTSSLSNGFKLPSFAMPDFRSGDMLTIAGIVLLTVLLYIVIMSLITSVTGSLWLTKVATRPLKDTYDVVLFDDGDDLIALRSYILGNEAGVLDPDQVDKALSNLPAVIFSGVKPSVAEQIIGEIREKGGIAGAN